MFCLCCSSIFRCVVQTSFVVHVRLLILTLLFFFGIAGISSNEFLVLHHHQYENTLTGITESLRLSHFVRIKMLNPFLHRKYHQTLPMFLVLILFYRSFVLPHFYWRSYLLESPLAFPENNSTMDTQQLQHCHALAFQFQESLQYICPLHTVPLLLFLLVCKSRHKEYYRYQFLDNDQ